MIGMRPVKASAVDHENLFLPQKIERKLFVISDIELLDIHPGEDIKSGLRFYRADPGNISQSLINKISLLPDTAARFNVAPDTLMASESRPERWTVPEHSSTGACSKASSALRCSPAQPFCFR